MLLLLHFKSSKKIELKIILEEREKKKKKLVLSKPKQTKRTGKKENQVA